MPILHSSSLRVRLLLFIFVCFLPTFGLILYGAATERQEDAFKAKENALRLARMSAGNHQQIIQSAQQLLTTLSHLPIVQSADQSSCSNIFAGLIQDLTHYSNIAAATADGTVFCTAQPPQLQTTINNKVWFKQALRGPRFIIGPYHLDENSKKATVTLALGVHDEQGVTRGVVYAEIDLTWLNRFAADAALPPGTTVTLRDGRGTILTRYPDAAQWVGKVVPQTPIVNAMLNKQGEGTGEGMGMDKQPRLFAFIRLRGEPGGDADLSIGIPTKVAFSEVEHLLAHNLRVLTIVVLITLALAWLGSDFFVLRRVRGLLHATKRISSGDFTSRTGLPHGEGELGELAQAFDRMAETLQAHASETTRAQQALHESERRYRTLFESNPQPMWVFDVETLRFVAVNDAAIQHYGYSRDEFLSMTIKDIRPAEDIPPLLEQVNLGKAATRSTGIWRHQKKNGTIIDVEIISCAVSFEGRHTKLVLANDLTERKRAEQRLQESERRFRALIENSSDAIALTNAEGVTTYVSPANRRITGYDDHEVIGRCGFDFIHPDDCETIKTQFSENTFKPGQPVIFQFRIRHKNGSWRWIECTNNNLLAEPSIQSIVVNYRDITERKQTQQALIASEDRFQLVVRASNDAIWDLDLITEDLWWNENFAKMFGYLPEDIEPGMASWNNRVHPDDQARVLSSMQTVLDSGGQTWAAEYRMRRSDETYAHVLDRGYVVHDERGKPVRMIGSIMDLSERMRAEQALEQLQRQHELILNCAGEGIYGINQDGITTFVNPAAARMLGYEVSELLNRPLGIVLLRPGQDLEPNCFTEELLIVAPLKSGLTHQVPEDIFWRKDGTSFPVEYISTPIKEGNEIVGAVIIFRDIIERKAQTAALKYQATHDALTELPNRTLVHDRLQQGVLTAQREHQSLSLLFLDLDRFKEINDTLCHHHGDLILQQTGQRLKGILREMDTVARLGGDEFAILLPNTDVQGALLVVNRALAELQQPFILGGMALDIGASIGIAIFPQHGNDMDTLMRHADVAMYLAKETGSGYAFYAPEQDRHSHSRLTLMSELRHAIEQHELVLYYQPKLDLSSGHIVGAEALVRWQHPKRGLIFPIQFISLAEESGLIKPLFHWVLNRAIQQHMAWKQEGLDISIAVNLSGRNLHDQELPLQVEELLRSYNMPSAQLELEITESVIMEDTVRAMEILTQLSEMGVKLSIDDFGTGYSSLAYLKKLPVDAVKIDKSFVIDMVTDEDDAVIVRSTIDLAHNLGMQVIAEGVENQRTWEELVTLGCDVAQGYYMSPPIPADELAAWIHARHHLGRGVKSSLPT